MVVAEKFVGSTTDGSVYETVWRKSGLGWTNKGNDAKIEQSNASDNISLHYPSGSFGGKVLGMDQLYLSMWIK